KIVIPKDEEIEDDNLREKLLKVNLLIAEIEALKDNPTPSFEFLTKSSSTSPTPFLEETNTFHNSLPEFENFCFDLEEIGSGSTTTHSDISLLKYEAFSFYDDHIEEISSGSTTTQSNISLLEYDSFIFDLSNDQFPPTDRSDFTHEEFGDEPAHIISPPEYDCFYFRKLPDPGELISSLNSGIRENLSSTTRVNLPIEDDYSPLLVYVDSLNSAAGGIFLDKMPLECLKVIESKSKVRQLPAKAVVAKVSTSSFTPAISSDVAELKDMVRALLLDKKNQSSAPAHSPTPTQVKAVEPNCVTCGGAHSYQNCPVTNENVYRDNIQDYIKANDEVLRNMQNQCQSLQIQMANLTDMLSKFMSFNTASSSLSGTLPSNTITNPKEELKGITTRSGVAYQGPTIPTPSKVVKQGTEPVVAPVSASMPNLKPFIPYPSRRDNERRRDQANEQIEKFYEIFKDMSFKISFMDVLILMPKFASTLKALIGNKEKLSEMARTSMNEHCSVVILNKLPRKLRDPGKFLIPYEFPGMDECLALADLASPAIVEPLRIELPFLEEKFQEDPPPKVPMADNQTMAELLQAPTEGYEDAIDIPEITANNFELKHGLINLVQNK
nr:hypothetical protein [Tanacetum cinerariifolium]